MLRSEEKAKREKGKGKEKNARAFSKGDGMCATKSTFFFSSMDLYKRKTLSDIMPAKTRSLRKGKALSVKKQKTVSKKKKKDPKKKKVVSSTPPPAGPAQKVRRAFSRKRSNTTVRDKYDILRPKSVTIADEERTMIDLPLVVTSLSDDDEDVFEETNESVLDDFPFTHMERWLSGLKQGT